MTVSGARFTSCDPDYPILSLRGCQKKKNPEKQTFDGDTQNVTQLDDSSVRNKGIFISKRNPEAINSQVIHTSDLVKTENRSHIKLDRIGVGRIRTFPFSCDSVYYYPVTSLSEWEAEAEEQANHNAIS